MTASGSAGVLVLGVGNLLMGDEGVGIHVIRRLQQNPAPQGVEFLDGGTGSFQLLAPMHSARKIVLIDATIDGQPAGTVRRLQPRFSSEYPRTLTAHDIGLKDLLDTFYLLEKPAAVTLFAVSISTPQEVGLDLSPVVADRVDDIARRVLAELEYGSRG